MTTIAGRYDLLARLGVGGTSVVHSARDRRTGCVFAIKRPRWRGLADWEPRLDARTSLEREYRVLSRLNHPHIVRSHDFGTDESGEPFLVLELLDEPRTILTYAHSTTREQRLRALVETFDALAHLHRAKVLHGDVKPSNVLVCGRRSQPDVERSLVPRTCLIDFGLAVGIESRTTPSADAGHLPPSLIGSALYLAPELAEGEPPSPASDLYAAGMIAAEVLTGASPRRYLGPRTTLASLRQFSREWLRDATSVADVGARATALLQKLLARDPKDRCSCASEAVFELEAIVRDTT